MSITLKDIAALCEVSISTVSLAINRPDRISDEVRSRIYSVIHSEGYKKKSNSVYDIYICVQDVKELFQNNFYCEVLSGIFSIASELNFKFKIFEVGVTDFYDDVIESQGVIFLGELDKKIYDHFSSYNIPKVSCGHPLAGYAVPSVYASRLHSTATMIQYLLNCGHKNIAYITAGNPDSVLNKEFIDAAASVQPSFCQELIYNVQFDKIDYIEYVLSELLGLQPSVTAVVCFNDQIAYKLCKCAKKFDLSVPNDLSVAGFDGLNLPDYYPVDVLKLTTVYTDKALIGRTAVKLLQDMLSGRLVDKNLKVLIPSYFTIGESVRRLE